MSALGYINSFESFGSVDGPGIRCVIFMQGCNMRCKYCHNPETWNSGGEVWSAKDIFSKALRYKNYWGKDGGITVSGGEPMLQAEFITELFTLAKKKGIHTALDTSGQPFTLENSEFFKPLFDVCDLVILDLKAMDSQLHKDLTGYTNQNILELAKWLSTYKKPLWIRHVLIPNITDTEADLIKLKEFISTLNTVEKIELLPYHTLGVQKWKKLGLKYPLENISAPTDEQIEKAKIIIDIK